jgi:hypothetical protein
MRVHVVALLAWGIVCLGVPTRVVALDCADLTPTEIEALGPPGVCDAGVHSGLQGEVDGQCKVERACKGNQDCPTLLARRAQNEACLNARETINATCFCGGNRTHRGAAEEARNAIGNCNYFLTKQKCTDCP